MWQKAMLKKKNKYQYDDAMKRTEITVYLDDFVKLYRY